MMLGYFLKKRKLFLLLLLSYIAILLISVVISFGIYTESGKIIESEISRANLLMLDQARQTMDNRMMDIERLAMQIALNPRVLNAVRVRGEFKPENQLNLYRTIEDLRHYMVSSGFITNIYIFLHDTDTLITPSTHIDARIFFNFTFGTSKTSYEEWKFNMEDSHRGSYLVFYKDDSAELPRRVIIHAQSIPIESIRNPLATIAITIDENKFRDVIGDVRWIDRGISFIMDENGDVVASSHKEIEPYILEHIINELHPAEGTTSGTMYSLLNEELNVITFSSSQVADWKYITIIPYSIFWEKAAYIRYLAWLGVLLTVFIGGTGSYLLARRNYSPVDKIIKKILGKSKTSDLGTSNEYQFIQDNISVMIEENEKISKRLEEQNRTLKDNFLLRLLKGKMDAETYNAYNFLNYGIRFHTKLFAVILINIETDSILCFDEDKTLGISRSKQAGFVVARSIEELINSKNQSLVIEEDDGIIACIVNFKEDNYEANLTYLLNVIQDAREFIAGNFGISFTATLSNIHDGSKAISCAYLEAVEAMEYKVVIEGGDVICYKDIKKSKCADYHYSIDTEQKLLNCIKTGDFEKTTSILMNIFRDNFSKEAFSHEMAKCLMFDLVSTIMKTAENMCDASFLEELQPVQSLSGCKTVMEMKFRLADILKKVCEYYETNKLDRNVLLSNRIKDYISLKYMDVNLGVSMIGEKFGLTPSYLSKLFKEQTNECLPEYITKVRIEMAMHFLRDDHATIFDVAQKVGYCNSNVFIRAFKKHQGITPGRFKEMRESS